MSDDKLSKSKMYGNDLNFYLKLQLMLICVALVNFRKLKLEAVCSIIKFYLQFY